MILTSVDLPAPFSPTRAWVEPAWSDTLPERSAATGPNDFETSRSSSVGVPSPGGEPIKPPRLKRFYDPARDYRDWAGNVNHRASRRRALDVHGSSKIFDPLKRF